MIFAYTLDKVLSGQKTQTRRIASDGETLMTVSIASGEVSRVSTVKGHVKWETGKTYAVQPGRNDKAVARILVTGLRRERVEDITIEDSQAEGYQRPDEFLQAWQIIHGAKADLSAFIWVISFELVT